MKNKGYAKLGGGGGRGQEGVLWEICKCRMGYGLLQRRKTKKGNDGGLHKLSQGKEKIE